MPDLPPAFSALAPYVDDWVLPDSRSRSTRRQQTAYADIRSFYDAALALAPAALEHLSACPLGSLSAADETLLKLYLALAEVGPAVEWYQAAAVVDGFPAERFPLIEQVPDCAPQE